MFSGALSLVSRPTAENLVPIRLDVEVDGQRLKDAFTWNANDKDTEIMSFATRLVQDLNLPQAFIQQITLSMQAQMGEFHALEGQQLSTVEKVQTLKLDLRINNIVIRDQFLWDVADFNSDPEEFARGLCKDLDIEDPEVGPAIAFAIREQLYEIAKQNVNPGRETRITKKARRERGIDFNQPSAPGTTALNLMRRPSNKISILRRKAEWEMYEPYVDVLSKEEIAARENIRSNSSSKKEKDDSFASRYVRA